MDLYFTYEAWEEQSTEERIVNRTLYAIKILYNYPHFLEITYGSRPMIIGLKFWYIFPNY